MNSRWHTLASPTPMASTLYAFPWPDCRGAVQGLVRLSLRHTPPRWGSEQPHITTSTVLGKTHLVSRPCQTSRASTRWLIHLALGSAPFIHLEEVMGRGSPREQT